MGRSPLPQRRSPLRNIAVERHEAACSWRSSPHLCPDLDHSRRAKPIHCASHLDALGNEPATAPRIRGPRRTPTEHQRKRDSRVTARVRHMACRALPARTPAGPRAPKTGAGSAGRLPNHASAGSQWRQRTRQSWTERYSSRGRSSGSDSSTGRPRERGGGAGPSLLGASSGTPLRYIGSRVRRSWQRAFRIDVRVRYQPGEPRVASRIWPSAPFMLVSASADGRIRTMPFGRTRSCDGLRGA